MRISLNSGELNSKFNFDKDNIKALSNSGISIFSVMNKCKEKADTNGDGVLSEKEISAFMTGASSEIMEEIQKELGSDTEIDQSFLQDMMNMIKSVIGATDKIAEDASSLIDMTKEDFLKNANSALDYENGSDFWKMIGTDNAEQIFQNIDVDGDGKLSEEEIQKLSNLDGDDKNLSLTDISSFLNTQDKEKITDNQLPVAPETESAASPEAVSPTTASNGASSGSGNGGPQNNLNTGNNDVNSVSSKARTKEDVDREINEQKALKDTTKQTAEDKISEQEALISQAVSESDLSDEFKKEYDDENKRLSGLIDDKEKAIDEKKSLEQDYNAEAKSYEGSISNIDSEIAKLNESKPEGYLEKIQNLQAEKARLEGLKTKAENNAQTAKSEAERLGKEKSDLETEKENILDKLLEKYDDEKERVEEVKKQIKEYEENIKQIKEQLEKDIDTIDTNIQTLKNEKAQIERDEDETTKKVLAENRAQADTTPVAWNGETSKEYWESLGYNADYGEQLLNGTIEATRQLAGSQNNCLGGVKRGFKLAFGENSPFGAENQGITVASQCLGVMQNSDNFREVTNISIDQARNLPAGTIVVWTSSTTGTSPASKYGHIAVLDGKGNEASGGRYDTIYRRVGENGVPHFFIPVS